jgi:hypothetical protein
MSDFIERIVIEKTELDDKLQKLGSFISSEKVAAVAESQKPLLTRQRAVMEEYSEILGERLEDLKAKTDAPPSTTNS